jgi:hypothetical protein
VSGFFLTRFAGVSDVGVIEGFAINILRMLRQQPPKGVWKVGVTLVRHDKIRAAKTPGWMVIASRASTGIQMIRTVQIIFKVADTLLPRSGAGGRKRLAPTPAVLFPCLFHVALVGSY